MKMVGAKIFPYIMTWVSLNVSDASASLVKPIEKSLVEQFDLEISQLLKLETYSDDICLSFYLVAGKIDRELRVIPSEDSLDIEMKVKK